MKRTLLFIVCAALIPAAGYCQPAATPAPKPAAPASGGEAPKTDEQKSFYALGFWLSQQVAVFDLSAADLRFVQMGLKDAILKNKPPIDVAQYAARLNELAQSRLKVKGDKEKGKAKDFLDKAAKAPGAQALPSGLIYTEVKAGTGASPAMTDTLKAHYHGTLVDGTVFDSSVQRGQPLEFTLGGVIKCWQEGIQRMKVGGKAKLVCPSEIAYGDRGSGGKIGPGATLVFEVELLEIVKKDAQPPAGSPMAEPAKKKGK